MSIKVYKLLGDSDQKKISWWKKDKQSYQSSVWSLASRKYNSY